MKEAPKTAQPARPTIYFVDDDASMRQAVALLLRTVSMTLHIDRATN